MNAYSGGSKIRVSGWHEENKDLYKEITLKEAMHLRDLLAIAIEKTAAYLYFESLDEAKESK